MSDTDNNSVAHLFTNYDVFENAGHSTGDSFIGNFSAPKKPSFWIGMPCGYAPELGVPLR